MAAATTHPDVELRLALFEAAWRSDNRKLEETQAKTLIDRHGRASLDWPHPPHPSAPSGMTLLHVAAAAGNARGVEVLVGLGATVDSTASARKAGGDAHVDDAAGEGADAGAGTGGEGGATALLGTSTSQARLLHAMRVGGTPLHACAGAEFTHNHYATAMELLRLGALASTPAPGGDDRPSAAQLAAGASRREPEAKLLRDLLAHRAADEVSLGLTRVAATRESFTVSGCAEGELALQIASDIHIEFYDRSDELPELVRPGAAPVLALLGDIGNPLDPRYEAFLVDMADKFELVLVLLGNHEHYNLSTEAGEAPSAPESLSHDEMAGRVARICDSHARLVFMENRSITVNGVRVLGTCLWTNVPRLDRCLIQAGMSDYYYITKRVEGLSPDGLSGPTREESGDTMRCITAEDTSAWHERAVNFLTHELRRSTAANEEHSVVLTHHTPYAVGVSARSHGTPFSHPMSAAFATDLSPLFRMYGAPKKGKGSFKNTNCSAWCFGHTHYNSDQTVFGTRLVSNQRGYRGVAKGAAYDPAMVVRVGGSSKAPGGWFKSKRGGDGSGGGGKSVKGAGAGSG